MKNRVSFWSRQIILCSCPSKVRWQAPTNYGNFFVACNAEYPDLQQLYNNNNDNTFISHAKRGTNCTIGFNIQGGDHSTILCILIVNVHLKHCVKCSLLNACGILSFVYNEYRYSVPFSCKEEPAFLGTVSVYSLVYPVYVRVRLNICKIRDQPPLRPAYSLQPRPHPSRTHRQTDRQTTKILIH